MKTSLCDLLGIQYPIIQAPIGSASCPALASAVSNAGGLGMLALSWTEPGQLPGVIQQTQVSTQKPFGINLCLQWDQQERLDICLAEGVKILSFFWGMPEGRMIEKAHQANVLVMQTVGCAEEAVRAVALGVDVIVAQGWEAGGHVWGQVAGLPLIPCVVDAVKPVPVVAAGGISDGRGIAAALVLGAEAVWIGTRFLVCDESAAHPLYKEKIIQAAETETVYSTLFNKGWPDAPHRTLRNSTVKAWEAVDRPALVRPGEVDSIATQPDGKAIERYSDVIPLQGMTGEVEALALYAGQSAGLVRKRQPAARIIETLMQEAHAALAFQRERI